MRVKAFSLIEIIVVIILIGIIFSLVLNTSMGKVEDKKLLGIEKISVNVEGKSILYMYGEKCEKSIIMRDDNTYEASPNFGFKKENKVLMNNHLGVLKEVEYETVRIENKKEPICFKLDFKNKKFFDKFIVTTATGNYLFLPLYQEVLTFVSLEDAKKSYFSDNLYPHNIDNYYHEK